MNLAQQVLDRLASGPLGRQIMAEAAAEVVERREQLARELADAEAVTLTARDKLVGQRAKLEGKASTLRLQLNEVESELLTVGYRLSDVESGFVEQRDKLWKELRSIPDEQLVAFRAELNARLESAATLFRQWPTGERDPTAVDGQAKDDNRASVDNYAHSVLRARELLDVAVRTGLAGDDARREIARIGAGLSPVRMHRGDHGSIPGA